MTGWVELSPVSYQAATQGTVDSEMGTGGRVVTTPTVVGGGSVVDGSDSSYYELHGYFDTTASTYNLDGLSCDFVLDPSVGTAPTALAVRVRVRTPPASLGNDPGSGTYRNWYTILTDVDDYLLADESGNVLPLRVASQATPAWFDYYYDNIPVDLSDPTDNGGWAEFTYYTGVADALTGSGLRVTMFMDSSFDGGYAFPWADVFEVRLLVACTTLAPAAPYIPPATAHPSLRMLQRGGTGGMSGIWRMVGNPTTRDSLRRGPGSIL